MYIPSISIYLFILIYSLLSIFNKWFKCFHSAMIRPRPPLRRVAPKTHNKTLKAPRRPPPLRLPNRWTCRSDDRYVSDFDKKNIVRGAFKFIHYAIDHIVLMVSLIGFRVGFWEKWELRQKFDRKKCPPEISLQNLNDRFTSLVIRTRQAMPK